MIMRSIAWLQNTKIWSSYGDDYEDGEEDYDDNNWKVTGLSPDTAYTVVMETSLGLGISHQVAILLHPHTDDDRNHDRCEKRW